MSIFCTTCGYPMNSHTTGYNCENPKCALHRPAPSPPSPALPQDQPAPLAITEKQAISYLGLRDGSWRIDIKDGHVDQIQTAGGEGAPAAPAPRELLLEMPADRRRNPILDGFQGLPPGEYRFLLANPKQEPGAASNGDSQGADEKRKAWYNLVDAKTESPGGASSLNHEFIMAYGRHTHCGICGRPANHDIHSAPLATPHTGSRGPSPNGAVKSTRPASRTKARSL